MTNIQMPSIYLCNRFVMEAARNTEFFAGKEQLMRDAWPRMKLLAACGERGIKLGQNLPEPSLKGMHVWELDGWPALYEVMYELSEAKWYRALGDTLASEDQDLLVNLSSGYGIGQRPQWQSDTTPGYRYLYERLYLKRGMTMHAYLRELNRFAAELSRHGIARVWCARHITGRPGQICLLWLVPEGVDVEQVLSSIATGVSSGPRYAALMSSLSELERELLLPTYSERLDERIRAGESFPIIPSPAAVPSAAAREPSATATRTNETHPLQ